MRSIPLLLTLLLAAAPCRAAQSFEAARALYQAVIFGDAPTIAEGLQADGAGETPIDGVWLLARDGFGMGPVTLPYALGLCERDCRRSAGMLVAHWKGRGIEPAAALNRAGTGREFGPADLAIYRLDSNVRECLNESSPQARSARLGKVEAILDNAVNLMSLGAKISRSSSRRLGSLSRALSGRGCQDDAQCRELSAGVESLRSQVVEDGLGD